MKEEIVSKRTVNSKTFKIAPNKYVVEIGNNTQTLKNGLWVEVDSSVMPAEGKIPGTTKDASLKTKNDFSDYDIHFEKNNPLSFRMVHIPSGKVVSMEARDTNKDMDISSRGNIITAREAWPGIDAEIIVYDRGVKTNFKITSKSGQRKIAFAVDRDDGVRFGECWYWVDGKGITLVPSAHDGASIIYDFVDVPVGSVIDPTVSFQPDESDSQDVSLASGLPNSNYGNTAELYIGNFVDFAYSNALIKFDLSGIPSGSVCNSATLSLWNGDWGDAMNFVIYSVLPANGAWNESSTWNYLHPSDVAWAGGNSGCGVSGTDINATPIGGGELPSGVNSEGIFALAPEIVETWFGASNANYGFLVKEEPYSSLTNRYCRSSNYTTAGYRPKLVVEYTDAPASGLAYRRTFSPHGARAGSRQAT